MHPLTSYSLPDTVRFALYISGQICRLPNLSGAALAAASYEWGRAHWQRGSFYRMLTRMLFGAGEPQHRFRMLERFYRLPEPLIERFYAGRTTAPTPCAFSRAAAGADCSRAGEPARGRPPARHRWSALHEACLRHRRGLRRSRAGHPPPELGIATTVVEARDKPGGRAYVWERRASLSTPARP
jgi:hypothetical protein